MSFHGFRAFNGFQAAPDGEPGDPIFESEEALDLSKYLHGIRRRWPLILVCCIIAVSVALVRYSLTTKMYRATTIIQIERKPLSLMSMGQAGWLENWWNQEFYPTQYRLLRSRGMAERVVTNLRLYEDPAFSGRQASLVPQGESVVTRIEDASELARLASRLSGGIGVEPIKETQLVELTFVSPSPELAARVANGYAEAFIQWGIESRASTVGEASSFLSAQIEALRTEIEEYQQKLNAYTHDNQLDLALDPAGEALVERRRNLESQYNLVVADRISKESSYRQLLNLSDEMVANTASGGSINALREGIRALEADYHQRLETYRPEWPDMVQLQTELNEKREQLNRAVRDYSNQVRDRAYADFQRARREETTLEEELRKLTAEARDQNSTALEYSGLVTHIETKKELLSELLKRQSQTEVASRVQSSQQSNVRIVDKAVVPEVPFQPSLRGDLSRSLAFGILLGVGIVVLIEYFDRTIKTPEHLERQMQLPTLAVIPDIDETHRRPGRLRYGYGDGYSYGRAYGYSYGYGYAYGEDRGKAQRRRLFGGKAQGSAGPAAPAQEDGRRKIELLPHFHSQLAICEAYRSLRTALLLSTAQQLRTVAVTSAEPSEGKTATASNLGVVLAQLGRRVLIIDADLRRPRMHKVFNLSNRHGLVNFLTGQVDSDGLFLQTIVPKLFVCVAGPIPPNPSELLSAQRMRQFLDLACERFDMVLIDTPPVLPVADAVIVGHQVEGVVLCARAGVLENDAAKTCRERLRYEKLKLLGTVLNRYRRRPDRGYKGYKYYAGYTGYGEDDLRPESVEEAHSAA